MWKATAAAMITIVLSSSLFAQEKAHKLPKQKKAPVIVLEYQGGFTPPRKNNEPSMQILADGTVILGAPFGIKKRIETKINQKEIQSLLQYGLDELKLSKFDAAKVKMAMKAAGKPRFAIADAPTTVIQINADDKTIEAKFYALGFTARQYPKIKELSRLEAFRKRLEKLRAEINAGGEKGIAKHLKLVNAELKAKYPKVKPLQAKDLQSAWHRANGKVYVNFMRQKDLGNNKRQFVSGVINYVDGTPKVTVRVNEVKKRQ